MLQLILGKEDTNEITEIYYHNIVISFNYRYRNTCKCFCIIIRCNKTYLYTKNQQEKAKEFYNLILILFDIKSKTSTITPHNIVKRFLLMIVSEYSNHSPYNEINL